MPKKQTTHDLPAPPDVIEFTVCESHITAGQRWSVISNPLAKALTDHLLDKSLPSRDVQVGYLLAYVNGQEYTLDEETKAWMNTFLHETKDKVVAPFKARLKKGPLDVAAVFNPKARPVYTHL